MINPLQIMQVKQTLENNHPKAAAFIGQLMKEGVTEGTIIELRVTRPGEETMITNLKVTQSDIDAIKTVKG